MREGEEEGEGEEEMCVAVEAEGFVVCDAVDKAMIQSGGLCGSGVEGGKEASLSTHVR